jgi:hypothetical protein
MVIDAWAVKVPLPEDAVVGDHFACDFGDQYVFVGVVVVGGAVDMAQGVDGVEVVAEVVGYFAVVVDLEHGGIVFVTLEVSEG